MKEIQGKLLVLFCILLILQGFYNFFEWKSDYKRQTNNLEVINQPAQSFTTRDGHQASTKKALTTTNTELRTAFPDVARQFHQLYIPDRLAESYTQASQRMEANIKAPVKDSIIYHTYYDTVPVPVGNRTIIDTVRIMDFQDPWISVHAELGPDTGNIQIQALDTVFTAIDRGPRIRPWLWILSRRQLRATAVNKSPYVTIEVLQAGKIK